MTTSNDYITVSKTNPTYAATCDDFGTISGPYKDSFDGDSLVETFALDFAEAVNDLHKWIKNSKGYVNGLEGGVKFQIRLLDGSKNKFGDAKRQVVYSISVAKAKKLLLK